ncbi:hypothetical protein FQZ97_1130010 [compost metagenome]
MEIARQPGLLWMAAKYAMCRAVHRRVRSSGVTAHSKAWPPKSAAISCTVSACSFTLAGEPWNSMSSMFSSRRPSLLCALTMRTVLWSISSQRAIGTPSWITWITVRTAASMVGNEQVAAEIAWGSG